MSSITDRRHHTRYPAHHLDVLARPNDHDSGPWALGEVVAVDFNRYGIALETSQFFSTGDVLSLVICTDDSATSKVTAVVCNRTPQGDHYRYGLQFDLAAGHEQQKTIQERLETIEQTIAN